MKLILLSLILTAAASFVVGQKIVQPLLEIKASISEQNTCIADNSSTYKNGILTPIKSVRIDLSLNVIYQNNGDLPIILDKQGGTIWGNKIYQKNADSTPSYKIKESDDELMFIGEPLTVEGNKPSDRFTVLSKGESFSSRSETRLLFDYPNEYSLYGGKEFFISFSLQSVSGAIEQTNDLNQLRQRWIKIGYFWFDNLETKPILFQFSNNKYLKVCN